MSAPLQGIRVIDFGRYIAAPYCGMLLADLGADVIRVERREGGEDRAPGPVTSRGEGGMFHNLNRNKRGVTLDLGSPESADVVRRLVSTADIVIANLPIKVLRKVGLDYETLKSIKEDIVLVMVSAFGADGPYAERVGFDGVAQAMSGAMHLSGFPEAPVRSAVPFIDYGTALHAANGAIAAIYQRRETGRGQVVEVSLLETSVTFMLPLLAEHAATDVRRSRQGNTAFFAAPSDAYETRDGWIIVATIGSWMFARWAKLVGRPELIDDPRFEDDCAREKNHEVVNEIMIDWCARRSKQEAMSELETARIPCGPVYDLDEVLHDPQVCERRLLEFVKLDGEERPVPLAHMPIRLGELSRGPLQRAPCLGEHTDSVLQEVGLSEQEIARLRELKVV
jgi:crotonobetainyl-CoA:carnitine CoA-transferase CaiB-like acyl-CoA transferase